MLKKKIEVSWNLKPLFSSDNDPSINKKRKEVKTISYKFINKWKSREDFLKKPEMLKEALYEYGLWAKDYGANTKELYYFSLLESKDQDNPKIKAAYNLAHDFALKIQNDIQFFELKLAKIDASLQKKFLTFADLLPLKHFLEKLFLKSKYLLTDPEEKIINLKTAPALGNWVRMTQAFLSKEEAEVVTDKGKVNQNFSEIIALMNNKNKVIRDSAAKAFNKILLKHLDVAENELNSVLQNKKVDDELRGYQRPDQERHIADDIDTKVVDALVKSVSSHFDIPKRFYKLKTKLLGLPKLEYHERNVEYGKLEKRYLFSDAVTLINKVLLSLDREFAEIFEGFITTGKIDVYPKKGKRSGAFADYGLISHPTYILLNFTGQLEDVRTFAHELGHGINFELVKKTQNALNFGTPISVTEVASTFFEDFVLQELERQADDKLRLAIMVKKLDDDVSTIFRQIAFYNFEWELHNKFREKGYLSKEEIGKIFQKHMASYMGPSVEQSEGSQNWWVYVSHFRYFFYVYSYASGLLISKSLQASVKKDAKFVVKLKDFLSAGLSESPENTFAKLAVDIADKSFWEKGISEVENLLSETEKLAKKLGKI